MIPFTRLGINSNNINQQQGSCWSFLKNDVFEFNVIKENTKIKTIQNTVLRKPAISTPKRIRWIGSNNIRQPQTNSQSKS